MNRAGRRKKKYRPAVAKPKPQVPAAAQPPAAPQHLVGWSLFTLAAETGIDRVQAFRALEQGVREGSIVRLECGDKTLYARLGGGLIEETPAPRHQSERATP
ncbi:MAG TPA: hypothetical protein DIW46_08385 [Microbacterium sp.]|nr:hypothetical protein [Microbacterium sp.]